jgi:hypothetical protein
MTPNNDLETVKYEDLLFANNYNNKLRADCYTTIRLYNPKKFFIGKRFNILLEKRKIHTAEVVAVTETTMGRISEAMAFVDAGMDKTEFTKLFTKLYEDKINIVSTTPLTFCVLKRLD